MFSFPFHKATLVKRIDNSRTKLYRMAYAWSHDAMLADDITQETLILALQKVDQLKNVAAFDGWMYTILNNVWLGYLRKYKPNENIDDIILTYNVSPEHVMLTQQINTMVRDAISQLPNGQRQVISLIDLEGLSYNEVANILQIPIGTVMSRLSRARSTLTSIITKKQRHAEDSINKLLHSTPQHNLCVVK